MAPWVAILRISRTHHPSQRDSGFAKLGPGRSSAFTVTEWRSRRRPHYRVADECVHGRDLVADEWHAAPARTPPTRDGKPPLQGSSMPADGCLALGRLWRPWRSLHQDGRAQAPRIRGGEGVAPAVGRSTSASKRTPVGPRLGADGARMGWEAGGRVCQGPVYRQRTSGCR